MEAKSFKNRGQKGYQKRGGVLGILEKSPFSRPGGGCKNHRVGGTHGMTSSSPVWDPLDLPETS